MAKGKPRTDSKKVPSLVALSGEVTINLDKAPDMPADAERLMVAATSLNVDTPEGFERAGELVLACSNRVTTIETFFEDDKVMANKLHKSITMKISKLTGPYKAVREVLEAKLKVFIRVSEYKDEQIAEEISTSGNALKDDLLKRSKDARMVGDIKLAKELEAQASTVVTDMVIPDSVPEVDGLGLRRPWKGEVENVMELIVAIAEGRVPLVHTVVRGGNAEELPLLEVNESVLNYIAKRLGKDMKIPGCRAYEDISFAASKKG